MNKISRNHTLSLKTFLSALMLIALGSTLLWAQDRTVRESEYVIFVSNRSDATELYLLNLDDNSVSQLTDTGRGHITPSVASGARVATFASREGSSYELFSAQVSSTWRTRRPVFAAVNRLTIDTIDQTNPTLTADGSRMAYAAKGGIQLMQVDGTSQIELVATDGNLNAAPSISPDGKFVAFLSNRSGTSEVWLANTSTRELRQLTKDASVIGGINWSADSQKIVFTTNATTSKLTGIAMAEVATGSFRVLTEAGDGEAALSSDGSRIVFTSVRSGDPELYLLNLNTSSVKRLTNNPGPDGSATFVSAATGSVRRTPPSRQTTARARE